METESGANSDTGSSSNEVIPETKPHTRSNLLSLLVLGFSIFLAGCTISLLAPFYTKEAEDHGLSVTSSGTVFASAFVLQIVSTPIFGKYLHKIGSSRLFIIGAIISGVTNIMFGFLPNIKSGNIFLGLSLTIRSMTAVGESAMSTSVYPLAMRCDQGSQSTVVAVMETMFGVGTTIGPFIGGFLFDYGGFLTPFVTCGCLLLVCSVLAFFILPKAEVIEVSVETGEMDGHDDGPNDAEDEHDADVAVMSSGTYRSLLRTPLMILAALVTFLTGVSTQWYQPSLEPYVRNQFGLTSFQASLLFIIDGGVYSLVAPLTGKILDKGTDALSVLGVGSFIICLGYLMLAPVPVIEPSLEQIAIGAGIHGVGMAMNFIATITLMTQMAEKVSHHLDREQVHGMTTSIWITCESFGSFIGSAGGGASYDMLGWSNSCILVSSMQAMSMLMVVSVFVVNIINTVRDKQIERKKLLDTTALFGKVVRITRAALKIIVGKEDTSRNQEPDNNRNFIRDTP